MELGFRVLRQASGDEVSRSPTGVTEDGEDVLSDVEEEVWMQLFASVDGDKGVSCESATGDMTLRIGAYSGKALNQSED